MEKLKKKDLLTHEEVLEKLFDTPKKRREFDEYYKEFVEENRREVLKEMGERVVKTRKKAGVTQAELARLMKTSRSTIARIEKGEQNLTVEYVIRVARALGRPFEVKIY